jgi:hypothetical protein
LEKSLLLAAAAISDRKDRVRNGSWKHVFLCFVSKHLEEITKDIPGVKIILRKSYFTRIITRLLWSGRHVVGGALSSRMGPRPGSQPLLHPEQPS